MKNIIKKRQKLQALAEAGNFGEVLVDINSYGKEVPWRIRKLQSSPISKAFHEFGEEQLSLRIANCGSFLEFAVCPSGDGYKVLVNADFCRGRMCVMCQWRRSDLIFSQLLDLIHEHHNLYSSDIPLLLTLTVPNVKGQDLKAMLDRMYKAFKQLMKLKKVKGCCRSWFRALEVTYNEQRDDYHPHFHILLMVPEAYFKRDRGLYIERDEWLGLWQEAMAMPEITQVDIRRVKGKKTRSATNVAAVEVGKYATKPGDYVKQIGKDAFTVKTEVVKTLHYALKARRLVGFGGLFFQFRKQLKQQDIEKADLVNLTVDVSDCRCKICQSTLEREMYHWHAGASYYIAS